MPLISVIMSVYKEPREYISLSVESILSQTFRDFEYIIVLDDPDNKMACDLLCHYAENDQRITLLFNDHNIGLTASLNKALKKCHGKYIARMDADDISNTKRLEEQLYYLEKLNLDLIGCELQRISEDGEIISALTNRSYSPGIINKLILLDDCIAHPSWFATRQLYKNLNGYREIYSCEDYDFLLRARKSGAKMGICNQILLSYRINTKGISRTNSLRQQLSADYLRKNFSRIENITNEEVEQYIKQRNIKTQSLRFEKAVIRMNTGIDKLKKKRLIGVLDIIIAPIHSISILNNYSRMIRMFAIKRKRS